MVYWPTPKGPKIPLYRPFKYFNRATPERYGGSLLKNMLAESPELFLCFCGFAFAITFNLLKLGTQDEEALRKVPYKYDYVVIRPTDPLMEHVRFNSAHYDTKYTKDIY